MERKQQTALFITVSMLMLAVSIPLSFMIGARDIPPVELINVLLGKDGDPLCLPILQKRVIRTVLGLITGSALGISGCLMQSVTRNPIADPSILGVNTGASFFVVLGIAFAGIHTSGLLFSGHRSRLFWCLGSRLFLPEKVRFPIMSIRSGSRFPAQPSALHFLP